MRKSLTILLAVAFIVAALPAAAELQNVVVGGSIKIRGNYLMNGFASPGPVEVRWPGFFLPARAIGDRIGGNTVTSIYSWNEDRSNDLTNIEQLTRLNVRADFTNEVSAFIEFDSYGLWGTDFRSNYITGFDFRNVPTLNDVDLHQGYIEAREMFGYPLRARIGRQELSFGNEWLVGTGGSVAGIWKRSFDAVRLTYATDQFSVDAWWSKLVENSPLEQDGDVDFYGIYGSYKGIENLTLDAYWLLVRDARRLNDTNFAWFPEWVEDIAGIDDYDVTNLHTIGLRGAGTYGSFDYNAELAYQFGNADQVGILFKPFTYGDQGANYDGNWGGNLEVGYTFDMNYSPRVYLGAAYLGGEDNRDISFWKWLNPFDRPKASVSFNRLFTSWEYNAIFDDGTTSNLSNAWVLRAGASCKPTEATEAILMLSYFETLSAFSTPRTFNVGRFRVPIAPALSFWDQTNSSDLSFEVGLIGKYHYSEDLCFMLAYAHQFIGDGLSDGNYSGANGLGFNGGSGNSDADSIFFEAEIKF
ncbi:MAG: alginate export family protein [Candidatus Hydrogenedentes bacterium]|nr:alginate export family protein [Candidatus Hydrogenedentota bacterium]